jgi:hypothetical protein
MGTIRITAQRLIHNYVGFDAVKLTNVKPEESYKMLKDNQKKLGLKVAQ